MVKSTVYKHANNVSISIISDNNCDEAFIYCLHKLLSKKKNDGIDYSKQKDYISNYLGITDVG